MKKRITSNLVCAVLGMLSLAGACLAATNASDTAMVAASFMSYAEHPTLFDSREIDARVATLLKQMTLKEKLGQLTQFSNGDATGPDSVKINQNELAVLGSIGSMLNLSGAKACNELQTRVLHLFLPIFRRNWAGLNARDWVCFGSLSRIRSSQYGKEANQWISLSRRWRFC